MFGGLKFFPQLSPAEAIGITTVQKLTCYLFPKSFCIYALAVFEVLIGVLLLFKKSTKIAISLAIIHLILTFTPFLFSPEKVFNIPTNSFTLLGQYIFKNIIIIGALIVLYPSTDKVRT